MTPSGSPVLTGVLVPCRVRRCELFAGYHGPHTWERLNPSTGNAFRRGRVVFLCRGGA